ncbi:uncharacterized protein UHOD_04496 [Ustilago sp. UG-2017b]|nr:uncharacterized protein UHOD_04496 [Ustilago sp. UG-2017b]
MASFKSLLLALMLTLMAAYNASCYTPKRRSHLEDWRNVGARGPKAPKLANALSLPPFHRFVFTDSGAAPRGTPQEFFAALNSVGRLSRGQEELKGRDWNSWINAYLENERRRLFSEQQNTARSNRPSG